MLCPECKKEYKNLGVHMKMAHDLSSPSNLPDPMAGQLNPPSVPTGGGSSGPDVPGMFSQMMNVLNNLNERITKIEDRGKGNEFKKDAKTEDIESAKANRSTIDPRIVEIVDQLLGEDFGIEIAPYPDRPGFLFTVIVPQRLSDLSSSSRPIVGEDGKYILDGSGLAKEEEYYPQDRRSRSIASHQSFDAIREHAERVRSYIVSYFTKMSKPIPEFKLKQHA